MALSHPAAKLRFARAPSFVSRSLRSFDSSVLRRTSRWSASMLLMAPAFLRVADSLTSFRMSRRVLARLPGGLSPFRNLPGGFRN